MRFVYLEGIWSLPTITKYTTSQLDWINVEFSWQLAQVALLLLLFPTFLVDFLQHFTRFEGAKLPRSFSNTIFLKAFFPRKLAAFSIVALALVPSTENLKISILMNSVILSSNFDQNRFSTFSTIFIFEGEPKTRTSKISPLVFANLLWFFHCMSPKFRKQQTKQQKKCEQWKFNFCVVYRFQDCKL